MSSKYTDEVRPTNSPRVFCIIRWNVAGAFTSPNGMVLNSYRPFFVLKAVFSLSSSLIGICQYPEARSNVVNHFPFPIQSKVSSILGIGKLSFFVTALSLL